MSNTCYMLYILAFTRNFLSFWMLHEIWRCIGVARFDNLGDARAFTAWNEWQDWLHVFMYIYQPFINHANMVAVGKKEE